MKPCIESISILMGSIHEIQKHAQAFPDKPLAVLVEKREEEAEVDIFVFGDALKESLAGEIGESFSEVVLALEDAQMLAATNNTIAVLCIIDNFSQGALIRRASVFSLYQEGHEHTSFYDDDDDEDTETDHEPINAKGSKDLN